VRVSEVDLTQALQASSSGITIADATRHGFPLTYVNSAFERLTGYGAAESLGRNCRFLQGPDTEADAVAEIAAALREQRETRVVVLNYRRDGRPFYNELRLAPVFDGEGRCVQVIGVQHDVSEAVHERDELARELAELRALQAALTPAEPPERPGLELATCFVPAEEGVAGDFHLVAPGPRDATVIALGDAMGHGVEAARRATFVRTALATFAAFTDDPVRLLALANTTLIERGGVSDTFVTAICVSYRPADGLVQWATAGHPPPLRLDDGEALPDPPRVGLPLGIGIDLGAARAEARLGHGEGLLLFTDGLTEARSPAGEGSNQLGEARVRALLEELRAAPPGEVVSGLCAAAGRHGGGPLADDLCVVALRATAA